MSDGEREREDSSISREIGKTDSSRARTTRDALLRRLREATRGISRAEERDRIEKSQLRLFFEEGSVIASLPNRFPDGAGSEHEIWIVNGSALKATMPGEAGRIWGTRRLALPSEYLERISATNDEFGMLWDFVGFAQECRQLRIVTTQPYLIGAKPTHPEIQEYMADGGFRFHRHRLGNFWFRAPDNLMAYDAEPRNFVKLPTEGLAPIDLILQHPDQETRQLAGLA